MSDRIIYNLPVSEHARACAARINGTHPAGNSVASVITTEFGPAVKVIGKGAKITARHWTRENYCDGITNCDWSFPEPPRHGLGYVIPYYDNPLGSLI